MILHVEVTCAVCGLLGEGTTADRILGRYETRWAELDGLADKHCRPGHPTTISTRPIPTTDRGGGP